MKNRVITISREFGSGGRTIGKKTAEKLGIPCYDNELIGQIAAQSGFNENYIKDAGEYAPGGRLSSALWNRAFGPTNEDYLWKIQYKIITDLAEKKTLRHRWPLRRLHPARHRRLSQSLYPCRHEIPR